MQAIFRNLGKGVVYVVLIALAMWICRVAFGYFGYPIQAGILPNKEYAYGLIMGSFGAYLVETLWPST